MGFGPSILSGRPKHVYVFSRKVPLFFALSEVVSELTLAFWVWLPFWWEITSLGLFMAHAGSESLCRLPPNMHPEKWSKEVSSRYPPAECRVFLPELDLFCGFSRFGDQHILRFLRLLRKKIYKIIGRFSRPWRCGCSQRSALAWRPASS